MVYNRVPMERLRIPIYIYIRYIETYSRGHQVKLGLHVRVDYIPTTAEQLQHVEDVHAILELYVWLARRYPSHYCDTEKAIQQKELSSQV